ncbi:WD40 repeat-like protein [Piedraia hortae CBS 480.64]|uniref:WD40 repeat-like protein n=1 Tax=Piedraia hortae CBS 480.64 TaxID=1314780 RepID=A0A6A7BVP7_9PEZI|nr:WD40 repeat-like protein [Piedraia hortae CBS 480.64]
MTTFPTTPLTRLHHPTAVHTISFTSTGQYLLTGSQDGKLRLYNTLRQSLIQTLPTHNSAILTVSISPSNTLLLSAGTDKALQLTDVATASPLRRILAHPGTINSTLFCGEAASLAASGSQDGTAKFWDLKSHDTRPVASLADAKDGVTSLAAAQREVLVGSLDGRVRIYDLRGGRCVIDTVDPAGGVMCVSLDESGGRYLVSCLGGGVRVMSRGTGGCERFFGGGGYTNEKYRVRSTFGMQDQVVIAGAEDGEVFVWDVVTGEGRGRVRHTEEGKGRESVVADVKWCEEGKIWASAGGDGCVVLWE